MNNLKYFPFERNNFYYGKLLSDQDFTTEQRYMNDKRRLHSRFLHGIGVAAGLRVVAVDEKSISLEDGLAVDFSGREILVDMPSIIRLSAIDGFEAVMEQGQGDRCYLCIEYEEQLDSPAHNVAMGPGSREKNYDKRREGYHLYLTDQEPKQSLMTPESLFVREELLYSDGQVLVKQSFPRTAAPGEEIQTAITVENRGNVARLSVSIEEELKGALYQNASLLRASWEQMTLDRGEKAVQTFLLTAGDQSQGAVTVNARPEQITVTRGGTVVAAARRLKAQICLEAGDPLKNMAENFVRTAMEEAVRDNYPQGIYLAAIRFLRTDQTYLIDSVEPLPFNQYVYSSQLLAGMIRFLADRMGGGGERAGEKRGPEKDGKGLKDRREPERLYASGVAEISLGVGGKRGQRFFSQEIFHGLGLGPVQVDLAIQEDDVCYSGSGEIFEEMKVKAELGAKIDGAKGCFTIGVRLTEPTSSQLVRVFWRASASVQEEAGGTEKRIYIQPGILELKVRESYYFRAICENVPGATVLWSVRDREGGSISGDGVYTAPNVAGVYEVAAQCQEDPSLRTSVFVVVRE